ncbi:hypothetical protein [Citrobacter europaeus]|uniref:hypothetical protein n=1 Tax=Citrobacter europaeus TaxID=1914243 RepID=UPI001122E5B8|nr:hypothetical protein [Citrobacter europaeus]UBI17852.1 hypothetical protein LA337_09250 [Citrobacter europaeus]
MATQEEKSSLIVSIGGNMFSVSEISLAIAIAPSVNRIVETACLAISLALLKHYGIIKPTRR